LTKMTIKDQILEYLKRERPLKITVTGLYEALFKDEYRIHSVRKAVVGLAKEGVLEKSWRCNDGRRTFYWVSYLNEPLTGLRPKSSAYLYH
jgi:hypothetical protein